MKTVVTRFSAADGEAAVIPVMAELAALRN
jgi:hypothetical protein